MCLWREIFFDDFPFEICTDTARVDLPLLPVHSLQTQDSRSQLSSTPQKHYLMTQENMKKIEMPKPFQL